MAVGKPLKTVGVLAFLAAFFLIRVGPGHIGPYVAESYRFFTAYFTHPRPQPQPNPVVPLTPEQKAMEREKEQWRELNQVNPDGLIARCGRPAQEKKGLSAYPENDSFHRGLYEQRSLGYKGGGGKLAVFVFARPLGDQGNWVFDHIGTGSSGDPHGNLQQLKDASLSCFDLSK